MRAKLSIFAISGKREAINWSDELVGVSAPLVNIVSRLLCFNPFIRGTAEELLQMSYFDDVRDPSLEKFAD
jgi:hypothetical protein